MQTKQGKERHYAIRKDGCWLAYTKHMGVQMWIQGELTAVPSGVYVNDIRYAKLYSSQAGAKADAKALGGIVFEVMG